jgi:hypothetical protein
MMIRQCSRNYWIIVWRLFRNIKIEHEWGLYTHTIYIYFKCILQSWTSKQCDLFTTNVDDTIFYIASIEQANVATNKTINNKFINLSAYLMVFVHKRDWSTTSFCTFLCLNWTLLIRTRALHPCRTQKGNLTKWLLPLDLDDSLMVVACFFSRIYVMGLLGTL